MPDPALTLREEGNEGSSKLYQETEITLQGRCMILNSVAFLLLLENRQLQTAKNLLVLCYPRERKKMILVDA